MGAAPPNYLIDLLQANKLPPRQQKQKGRLGSPGGLFHSNRLSRLLDNDDLGLAARTDAAVQVDNVLVDQADAA